MSNLHRETLGNAAQGSQSRIDEREAEPRGFRLTEELFEELHTAEESPERIVQLLGLYPEAILSALSGNEFNEDEKQCLRELLGAAETLAQKEREPSPGNEFDKLMAAALRRLGVPTRQEVHVLTQRIEELTIKVDMLKRLELEPTQAAESTVMVSAPNTVVRADG